MEPGLWGPHSAWGGTIVETAVPSLTQSGKAVSKSLSAADQLRRYLGVPDGILPTRGL